MQGARNAEVADAVRLPFEFDAAALQADLRVAASGGWIDHFVKRNYDGSWSVIALRGPSTAVHPVQMIYSDPTCTDFRDTPVLAQCAYIRSALDRFACPLQSVRLMRLEPGSVVHEHRDHELSVADGFARIHVPITTNPRVTFLLNQRRILMREGECWYLRLSDPHSVRNDGDASRVHLVIDAVADEWLTTLLSNASNTSTDAR